MTPDSSHPAGIDEDLLRRTADGEAAAFAELFRRQRQVIYRFALHMTGRPAAADDVVQEVFLRVMLDAARYQSGRSGVAAWLCGIARNCARQWLDRDRPFQPLEIEMAEATGSSVLSDPLGDLTRAEGIARLRKAVLSLPVHYREAVVLCDLEELSYADAADAIGCAIGTVRSRLSRGRVLLAAKLVGRQTDESAVGLGDVRCPA